MPACYRDEAQRHTGEHVRFFADAEASQQYSRCKSFAERPCYFFSSRRRHRRFACNWSPDVCSSDLAPGPDPSKRTVMFLVFMLATLGANLRLSGTSRFAWMVPVLVLAVPIFDTTLVSISRLRRGLDRKSVV